MIDSSLLGNVLQIPTNGLISNPFSGSAFGSINSAIGGLPSMADFTTAMQTSASSIGTTVTQTDIDNLSASLSSLNGLASSGNLSSMDQITAQMTSHIIPGAGGLSSIPNSLFSYGTVTSSLTTQMGVPNALSMLSSAQNATKVANQLQGGVQGTNHWTCNIAADITGAVHQVQSGISSLYNEVSSGINSLESSINASVTKFANAVKAALPSVGPIDPITGLPSSIPGVPIASSLLKEIHDEITSAESSVTSAIKSVVNTIDAAAVSIENQMKVGIANALHGLKSDPCFGNIATTMMSPALTAVATANTSMSNASANVALLSNDVPPATTSQLAEIAKEYGDVSFDTVAITNAQQPYIASLSAWQDSVNYQQVKQAQTQSPEALTAYQALRAQANARSDTQNLQALKALSDSNHAAKNQLKALWDYMKNTGVIASNPNGPWSSVEQVTIDGKLYNKYSVNTKLP
jgi:hypothetical protein